LYWSNRALGAFIAVSLMIRLYANIFAGHIVLMSIIGLMFISKAGLEVPIFDYRLHFLYLRY
jgi:F0F1-type ATP synthase membrane subunit a